MLCYNFGEPVEKFYRDVQYNKKKSKKKGESPWPWKDKISSSVGALIGSRGAG